MPSPRAITIAVWIFSINACFAIFDYLDPFSFGMHFGVDMGLINSTAQAANITSVSGFGIAEAVLAFNMFINLILGPLMLVPTILNIIGVVGLINWIITGSVWLIYAIFIVQLLTGRLFKVMQ